MRLQTFESLARIEHFRVTFVSVSKRVPVQNLSYENEPVEETHFHTNGFARRLV